MLFALYYNIYLTSVHEHSYISSVKYKENDFNIVANNPCKFKFLTSIIYFTAIAQHNIAALYLLPLNSLTLT